MAITPIPFLEESISQTISSPNSVSLVTSDLTKEDDIANESKEEEEDSAFDDFFESIKNSADDLHKVSGGSEEMFPTPNMGNLFDPGDEVMSRILIGAAILAALRRNTLFSMSGPAAVAMAVFYPIIYLAMVFTDMFLFGNVKFDGE